MTPNLFDFMQTYDVRHDGDNMSDHSIIYTVFNIDMENTTSTGDTGSADTADPPLNRPHWKHVSAEQHARYTYMLNELLYDIQVPTEAIECTNSKCDSQTYDIELFHDQIINACLTASRHILCQPKSKNKKHVTGWDIYVRGHRSDALFWHAIWKSCGSPRRSVVAQILLCFEIC